MLESVPDRRTARGVLERDPADSLCQRYRHTVVQCPEQREYGDLHLWYRWTAGCQQCSGGLGEPAGPVSIRTKWHTDWMVGRLGADYSELPGGRSRRTSGAPLPARESHDVLHVADGTEPMEPVALAHGRWACRSLRSAAEHCLYRSDGLRVWILFGGTHPAAVQRLRQSRGHSGLLRQSCR